MGKVFIAEAAIHKQKTKERHLLWYYSHFKQFCWLLMKNNLVMAW